MLTSSDSAVHGFEVAKEFVLKFRMNVSEGIPGVSSRFSHQIDSDQLMRVRSLLTLPHILTPELLTSLPTPLLGLYGNRPSPFVIPLVLRGRR